MSAMYSLKPIISHVENIKVPNTMYTIKPIYGVSSSVSAPAGLGPNEQSSKMEVLEARQQNILLQLKQLKDQLLAMHGSIAAPAQDGKKSEQKAQKQTRSKTQGKSIDVSLLTEIVVNASPDAIPYSLLALKNLWKDRLNIEIQCYTHSTVASLSEEVKNFQSLVQNNQTSKLPNLKVVLIWKTVSFDTEMIIGTDLPVMGEVNILRHLSRIGPNEFNYESKDNCNEIDVVFDLCYMLKTSSSAKERQTTIKHLNSRLGKAQFYGESTEISIGDLAFGSTIKQLESVIGKDLLPNLKSLLLRVTEIAKF